MRKTTLISSIAVTATLAGVPLDSAQAAGRSNLVDANSALELGLDYGKMVSVLSTTRPIKEGELIRVTLYEETNLADLATFDDLVIQVPIDNLMANPNREWFGK